MDWGTSFKYGAAVCRGTDRCATSVPECRASNPTTYEASGSVPEVRLNVGPDEVR